MPGRRRPPTQKLVFPWHNNRQLGPCWEPPPGTGTGPLRGARPPVVPVTFGPESRAKKLEQAGLQKKIR